MPHILIASEQPIAVRGADAERTETIDRLEAELRRPFELEGAVRRRGGHRL